MQINLVLQEFVGKKCKREDKKRRCYCLIIGVFFYLFPLSQPSWALLFEEFVLKNYQIYDSDGDVCIGEVENCPEEVVVGIDQEVEPARATIPLKQREVEHIDHTPHHKGSVAASELRHGRRRGCREDEAVECAVDDVAYCARHNHREAYDDTLRGLLTQQVADVEEHRTNQTDAEEAQQQLAPVEAAAERQLHTEGCAVIFDKVQAEPVGDNRYRLVEVHRRLDPYFERLVSNKQHKQQD